MGKKKKIGIAGLSVPRRLLFGALLGLSIVLAGPLAGPLRGQADEILGFHGNCNSDNALDISDAIFLLSFMFLGGNPPQCEERCEFNLDGRLDIGDSIAFLQFFFLGGVADPGPLVEVCDGIDNDCDGIVDEGCPVQIDLLWDKVTVDIDGQPEKVAGYRIYFGTTGLEEDYVLIETVGPDCGCVTLGGEGLPDRTGGILYFAVKAFDQAGNVSAFSKPLQIVW